MHGSPLAMCARALLPNARGYALVATQAARPAGALEAPCRLAVLCERPLAPLAELPCVRVERFEGARQRVGAAGMVALCAMWVGSAANACDARSIGPVPPGSAARSGAGARRGAPI